MMFVKRSCFGDGWMFDMNYFVATRPLYTALSQGTTLSLGDPVPIQHHAEDQIWPPEVSARPPFFSPSRVETRSTGRYLFTLLISR